MLFDRDEAGAFGGLARESFGGMFFVDSPEQRRLGIRDSADLALRDWHDFAEFGAEDFWPRAWAQAYVQRCTTDIYRWVRRHGVRFLPVVNWVERGEFRPGNSVPRFHVTWGRAGVWRKLIGALRPPRQSGSPFTFGIGRSPLDARRPGRRLWCDDERAARRSRRAPGVVVAGGGINGDLDRVRRNWHRHWNARLRIS
jgi:predicted oxidoreductase